MKKEHQHSIDFINRISNKNTGYQVPQNYFEHLEDDIFDKLSSEKFPNKNNFEVPERYFENLENQIVDKVFFSKKTPVISLQKRVQQLVPIVAAASVLLFISINYFSNKTININDISNNEVENWFASQSANIDNTELALALELTEFDDHEFFNSAELENYLNDVDTSILISELQ